MGAVKNSTHHLELIVLPDRKELGIQVVGALGDAADDGVPLLEGGVLAVKTKMVTHANKTTPPGDLALPRVHVVAKGCVLIGQADDLAAELLVADVIAHGLRPDELVQLPFLGVHLRRLDVSHALELGVLRVCIMQAGAETTNLHALLILGLVGDTPLVHGVAHVREERAEAFKQPADSLLKNKGKHGAQAGLLCGVLDAKIVKEAVHVRERHAGAGFWANRKHIGSETEAGRRRRQIVRIRVLHHRKWLVCQQCLGCGRLLLSGSLSCAHCVVDVSVKFSADQVIKQGFTPMHRVLFEK